MKRMTATVLVLVMTAASALPLEAASRSRQQQTQATDTELLGRYVRSLQVGSRIKVELVTGKDMKGTLMGVEEDQVILKPKTRIPEPALRIPLRDIASVEIDKNGSNIRKSIAIGAAAGAGAALGVFLIILAAFAD